MILATYYVPGKRTGAFFSCFIPVCFLLFFLGAVVFFLRFLSILEPSPDEKVRHTEETAEKQRIANMVKEWIELGFL